MNGPALRIRLSFASVACAPLFLALASCAWTPSSKSHFEGLLVVSGSSSPVDSPVAESLDPPEITWPDVFAAAGSSRVEEAKPGARRIALARAEARRAALRGLAGAVVRHEFIRGMSIADLLTGDEEARANLENVIESQNLIEYETRGETIEARATLAGEAVAGAIDLSPLIGSASSPAPTKTDAELNQVRADAEAEAITDARGRLLEALLASPAGRKTVGDRIGRDGDARALISQWIADIVPLQIEHGESGACTATLVFDRARLNELF